jgi:hypothetical protein
MRYTIRGRLHYAMATGSQRSAAAAPSELFLGAAGHFAIMMHDRLVVERHVTGDQPEVPHTSQCYYYSSTVIAREFYDSSVKRVPRFGGEE